MEAEILGEKIPVTAIIVTYNEGNRLRDCLNSIAFCAQIIVIDLGSADDSAQIARTCGAEVYRHDWVPIVEHVLNFALSFVRNDWILRLDPDEVFPPELAADLIPVIVQSQGAAEIGLPFQYYFLGKPLRTTIWGGRRMIPRMFHKDRAEIMPYVHKGFNPKRGYARIDAEPAGDYAVRHYWADSFEQLFEKHNRYLRHEGESRYRTGQRFSWHKTVFDTLRSLGMNLIYYRGLVGGRNGIFLSFYYSWYVFMGWLSLRGYQRNLSDGRAA